MSKKVLVGMSGGIDSSLSAYFLQQQGYEVQGVYMKLHNLRAGYHEKNLETIKEVAEFLKIKYHVLDLSEEFKTQVYDYFVNSYIEGITPNPCVRCNRLIKFGAMLDFAKSLGIDFLATGHYVKTDGEFLYVANDLTKDQSYFLAQLKKEALKYLIFPMEEYKKVDMIKLGEKLSPIYKKITLKKESQEICFVDTIYTDIIKKHAKIDMPGNVLSPQGQVIGKHKGYMHYTIGKRRGFSVDGAHEAHFVKEINPKTNELIVSKKEELAVKQIIASGLNMFIDDKNIKCEVKLRYRSTASACEVKLEGDTAIIELEEPVFGVAAGQLAVFYDKDKVLGSAWIKESK